MTELEKTKPGDFELTSYVNKKVCEPAYLDADYFTLKRVQEHREWLDKAEKYLKSKKKMSKGEE